MYRVRAPAGFQYFSQLGQFKYIYFIYAVNIFLQFKELYSTMQRSYKLSEKAGIFHIHISDLHGTKFSRQQSSCAYFYNSSTFFVVMKRILRTLIQLFISYILVPYYTKICFRFIPRDQFFFKYENRHEEMDKRTVYIYFIKKFINKITEFVSYVNI